MFPLLCRISIIMASSPTTVVVDVKTPTSLNTVPHSPLTSCLCTPNTVFPVAHKHTWRRRHWSHLSQTVAQHSAESRHTDPLHTITSRTHDCQNTPRAISSSTAHVHTVRAPGPEDKACPSNLPVSKDSPAQSQHTHSTGTSQPTTTLRSGEHSVFYTTLSPVFFWSSRPYPVPGQSERELGPCHCSPLRSGYGQTRLFLWSPGKCSWYR